MSGKKIAQAAVIAAIYVVLTVSFAPFSYGVIQVRISEALTVIAGLTPVAIPGLFIGCIIANLFSGLGVVDIIIGSVATLMAAYLSWRLRKNMWLVPIPPIIVNAVIVGTYLTFFEPYSIWVSIAFVGLGEAISCYVLGLPLLIGMKKWNIFK